MAAITSSLAGITMHVVFAEGNIFEGIGNAVRKHFSEYWGKPVATCPICMSFWYGLIIHILLLQTYLPVAVIGSTLAIGLTALLVGFYKNDEDE
jgi:hypothetical protein